MNFQTTDWLLTIGIFAGYALVDGLYVYYTLTVVRRQAFRAASVSFIMNFILAAGVFTYTQNFFYVIPIALGSFVGTYLVTRYAKDEQISTAKKH